MATIRDQDAIFISATTSARERRESDLVIHSWKSNWFRSLQRARSRTEKTIGPEEVKFSELKRYLAVLHWAPDELDTVVAQLGEKFVDVLKVVCSSQLTKCRNCRRSSKSNWLKVWSVLKQIAVLKDRRSWMWRKLCWRLATLAHTPKWQTALPCLQIFLPIWVSLTSVMLQQLTQLLVNKLSLNK